MVMQAACLLPESGLLLVNDAIALTFSNQGRAMDQVRS